MNTSQITAIVFISLMGAAVFLFFFFMIMDLGKWNVKVPGINKRLFKANHLYPIDKGYDLLLSRCLDSGIYSVKESYYEIELVFNNGVSLNAWNANRWYSWIKDGRFRFPSGKVKQYSGMVTNNTMARVLDSLEEFQKIEIERELQHLDYAISQLLPPR